MSVKDKELYNKTLLIKYFSKSLFVQKLNDILNYLVSGFFQFSRFSPFLLKYFKITSIQPINLTFHKHLAKMKYLNFSYINVDVKIHFKSTSVCTSDYIFMSKGNLISRPYDCSRSCSFHDSVWMNYLH